MLLQVFFQFNIQFKFNIKRHKRCRNEKNIYLLVNVERRGLCEDRDGRMPPLL